jgi:RNA polymerase sigma factor (sigma-70 family)
MEPNPVRIEELLAHAGWVRKLAARLVRDAGAADDVTQEVWAYALRSPPSDRRNLRGWLAAVVQNTARAFGRSESRRAAREALAARSGAEEDTAELVERGQLHRRLVELVMALEEPYRSIVLAHWFEGESIPEIARRQGLTPKMARTRLDAAHAQLRKRLDESSGGREAWVLAFVKWMAPRQVAVAGAAIGGIVLGKKVVVAGIAAVLLWIGWFAWSRAPVQLPGEQALAQSTPRSPELPSAVVAPIAQEPRRSISQIFVVDECAHPLAGARVTVSSSTGERALGVTDEHGVFVIAPEDAAGPASVSHDGFESAQIPDLGSDPTHHLTLLDTNAITGRVHSFVQGFRPESVTVIALEAPVPDSLVSPERLSHVAATTRASADGTFRLACLSGEHAYTILAGGDGWVSTVPEMANLPFVRDGEHGVDLGMTRLFAAVLEFRDQEDEPAHFCAAGYVAGTKRTFSRFPGAMPDNQISAGSLLAGASPTWATPAQGSLIFLFRADSADDQLGPNRLEFSTPGYDDVSLEYFARSVRQPIEPTRVTVQRTVTGFGTVRIRFMADSQHPATPAACPQGKLRLEAGSGATLEFGIASPAPEMDISNVPVGNYRLRFAPRKGHGTIPDSEEQAPLVEITRGAVVDFQVSLEPFGSVRLVLQTESGAAHHGEFAYMLRPAKRDPDTGKVTRTGGSEMISSQTPPSGFQGLRAGTYLLTCLVPRPLTSSPEAGPNEIVVEVVAGQEQTVTVKLRVP